MDSVTWDDAADTPRELDFPDDYFLCDGPCELMIGGVPITLFSVDAGGCATSSVSYCYECFALVMRQPIYGEKVQRRRVDGVLVDTIGGW